jgi:hypothetical protein
MPTRTYKQAAWDDESNEAQSNFVSWGKPGDFIYGTLIGIRQVKSTLADKAGQMQPIYDFKVMECEYHLLDEKKNPVDESTVCEENDLISVGGRSSIDSRMARAKIGQIVGLKFIEEIPNKKKGYNATKSIRVYFPKNQDGTVQMDEKFLESQADELDSFEK